MIGATTAYKLDVSMTPETAYIILAMFFFFVFVYSLAWVYQDANTRGKIGGVWPWIV